MSVLQRRRPDDCQSRQLNFMLAAGTLSVWMYIINFTA